MNVGMSKILDREGKKSVKGREPIERAHRSVIGASVVNSELMSKVGE